MLRVTTMYIECFVFLAFTFIFYTQYETLKIDEDYLNLTNENLDFC